MDIFAREECQCVVCCTCKFEEKLEERLNEKKILCSNCYTELMSAQQTTTTALTEEYISRQEMVVVLAAVGSEVRATGSYVDIYELYDALIVNKKAAFDSNALFRQVSVPEQSSSFLDSIEFISKFDILNGGRYMHELCLMIQQKIEITKLLAELVTFNNNRNENNLFSHSIVHKVQSEVPVEDTCTRKLQKSQNTHKGSLRSYKFRHIKTSRKKILRGGWVHHMQKTTTMYFQHTKQDKQKKATQKEVPKWLRNASSFLQQMSNQQNASLSNKPNKPVENPNYLGFKKLVKNASSLLAQLGPQSDICLRH